MESDISYNMLEVSGLWKNYNGSPALQGLNLKVKRGEIMGLLGPNGAGKTTALKIIVGLLKMERGAIRVDGVNILDEPFNYKKIIGYVPEDLSLPRNLKVKEFLTYIARLRDIQSDKVNTTISYYMNIFDLEEYQDNIIGSLSRGMKQRLAILTSLIHTPRLLVLDEPFIGLDPIAQHKSKELFIHLLQKGGSVLLATHFLDVAERICNRVTVIFEGRDIATGNLGELRKLADSGGGSTLEEVFIRLIKEAKAYGAKE